jgi:multiple sugar transport system permease protein
MWKHSIKRRSLVTGIAAHVLMVLGAIIFLIPFAWMLSTALKDPGEVYYFPPTWIPNPIVWGNFSKAVSVIPFLTFMKNSIIITSMAIVGTLISSSLVAFGFSRLQFAGRDLLFFIMLATMMLPYQVTMIPVFIIFKTIGWIDTHKPLIFPYFLGGSPFYIFLLRQFYLTLPRELDDAARIDGCSTFRIYASILMPLLKPALASVAIFSFMFHWNDFLGPLVYLSSMENFTLAVGLNFFKGQFGTEWNLLMAASTLVMLPCLVIFLAAQKVFIQGVVMSGIKG